MRDGQLRLPDPRLRLPWAKAPPPRAAPMDFALPRGDQHRGICRDRDGELMKGIHCALQGRLGGDVELRRSQGDLRVLFVLACRGAARG